ncbi:MAG TPA: DNA ligase D, partial [Candidatus Limnocylindrales bacterium]
GGRYVVQRHRATRLHFDFRLEIGGVLVSWAIPKGPTLDPGVRRMAVHVEDHPVEYFDFEGVIPARQYGAGDVIVWDWGRWSPETDEDPRRAIADGELKFDLAGEKLRGRFTIVRTSGRSVRGKRRADDEGDGKDEWLLIKKRDGSAVPGWDAEDHPRSVKTGRTNDEVKARRDALWMSGVPAATAELDLSAARAGPFPSFIEPMKATLASDPFSDDDWLFEVKWDGYRVEALVDHGRVRTFTRNGNDAAAYFPGLLDPPTWIAADEAVVDGEVVAIGPDGAPSFELLQTRLKTPGMTSKAGAEGSTGAAQLVYQAFDLLYLDGRSLLAVPLETRKTLLRTVIRDQPRVRYADHVVRDGRDFYDAAAERGLEGVVAKLRRSPYEPGRRSPAWLKIKARLEQEVVVGGYLEGQGNAARLGALLVGVHDDGRLRYAGRVGSGFDDRARRMLRERLDAALRDMPAFDPPPPRTGDLRKARWVAPTLVARVAFASWTRDGLLRQPSFTGLELDRDPSTVVRERPAETSVLEARAEAEMETKMETRPEAELETRAEMETRAAPVRASRSKDRVEPGVDSSASVTPAQLEALAALRTEGAWEVGGETLKLTNLDKELFSAPEPWQAGAVGEDRPVTKRELIAYFARIAPAMLPYLADRPLNLHRYPNGAFGKGFWQKDIPETAPRWLRRWTEPVVGSGRDPNDHLLADGIAALCWLGNQAAFEIHAWTTTIHDLEHPSYALIDIDPGTKTTWEETLTLARLYRTALDHLGVRGWPKVTGRRGIQVWIPVEPRYTYAETSAWVEGVSRAVGAAAPGLVSWEWSVSARGGRARLDYTQNSPIKTLVAPYAVRPGPGGPVSAPIAWDELDDGSLRPDRWTVRSMPDRVGERGDLFAGLITGAQALPPL